MKTLLECNIENCNYNVIAWSLVEKYSIRLRKSIIHCAYEAMAHTPLNIHLNNSSGTGLQANEKQLSFPIIFIYWSEQLCAQTILRQPFESLFQIFHLLPLNAMLAEEN